MDKQTVLVKFFSKPAPIELDVTTPLLVSIDSYRDDKTIHFCEMDGNRLFSIGEVYGRKDLNKNKHMNVYALNS